MKVLALETSTLAGSVALVDDGEGLIGETRMNIRVAHSERLMPSIQWLLDTSHSAVEAVDAFAVSIGPGSFTGLRIGLSTAKGLAFAAGKPVVPVLTLDAFARSAPYSKHLICPMLDARKNQVFTALYRWEDGGCRKILQETAIPVRELIENMDGPALFMGEGARVNRECIEEKLGAQAVFAPVHLMNPTAATVAEIAFEHIHAGIEADPVSLVPYYIRKSEAESHWKA